MVSQSDEIGPALRATVAGNDYPRTYREFALMFPDAGACTTYLEEFTFRLNRRTSRSRGLVFRRLLEQIVSTGPITEGDLAHGYDWTRPQDVGGGGAN